MQPNWELSLQRYVCGRTIFPDNRCSAYDVSMAEPSDDFHAEPYRAAYVIGRNDFIANGQTATIGEYAFAFIWAAMACLFVATVFFCVAGVTSRKDKTSTGKTGGRFSRRKTTKERGSFLDTESQRQVNKEYT